MKIHFNLVIFSKQLINGVKAKMENSVISTPLNYCSSASVTAKRKLNLLKDSSVSKVSYSQVTASSSNEMEDADITVQKLRSKKSSIAALNLFLPFEESNRLKSKFRTFFLDCNLLVD